MDSGVMQDPRRLRVYPRSKGLAVGVLEAIKRFPADGHADLKKQMKRSVESIVFNIAEGCGADTRAEFARFLGISIKSAFELDGQLDLSSDYRIISVQTSTKLKKELEAVRKMLYRLRQRVLGYGDDQSEND